MTRESGGSQGSVRMLMRSRRSGSTSISKTALSKVWPVRSKKSKPSLKQRISLSLRQWYLPGTVCTCIGPSIDHSHMIGGAIWQMLSNFCVSGKDCQPTMLAQLTRLGCSDQSVLITGRTPRIPSPWNGSGAVGLHSSLDTLTNGLRMGQTFMDELADHRLDAMRYQTISRRQLLDNIALASTLPIKVASKT